MLGTGLPNGMMSALLSPLFRITALLAGHIARWRYRAGWIDWVVQHPANFNVSVVIGEKLLPVLQTLDNLKNLS